jgi:hypothetical protein
MRHSRSADYYSFRPPADGAKSLLLTQPSQHPENSSSCAQCFRHHVGSGHVIGTECERRGVDHEGHVKYWPHLQLQWGARFEHGGRTTWPVCLHGPDGVNASGGIDGHKVNVISKNDQGVPATSIAQATSLIDDSQTQPTAGTGSAYCQNAPKGA